MRRFFEIVLMLRWPILAAVLGVTVWLGSYLLPVSELKYDFSFKRLFLAYGGDREALREFHDTFGDDVGFLSVLVSLPKGPADQVAPDRVTGTVFEPAVVRKLQELADWFKARREIDSSQVYSAVDAAFLHGEIRPGFLREELRALDLVCSNHEGWTAEKAVAAVEGGEGKDPRPPPAVAAAVQRYQQAKVGLSQHRVYIGRVLSQAADAAMVIGRFNKDHPDAGQRRELLQELQDNQAELVAGLPAGAQIHLSGIPLVQKTYTDMTMQDLMRFMPIISAVMCFFLFMLFRHVHAVLLPMMSVGIATVWVMGLMQANGEPINLLSNVIPVTVMVIGVAESIHILARYYQESANEPDRTKAILATMVHMAPACFLASATTAIGFGSLLTAQVPAIGSFGIHSAYGIGFTFVLMMFLVPIGLSFVKRPTSDRLVDRDRTMAGVWLSRVASVVIHKPRRVMIAFGLVLVASVGGGLLLEIESKVLEELGDGHPVSQALHKTQETMSGVLVHAVAFEGKELPGQTCYTDEECEPKDCDPAKCAFADCCRTRVCKKRDAAWHLVNTLHQSALTMTDTDKVPVFGPLADTIRAFRSRSYVGAKAAPPTDGDIVIDDGEGRSEGDELIIDETDSGSHTMSEPRTPKVRGICAESAKNVRFIREIAALDDWLTGIDAELRAATPTHPKSVSRVTSVVDLLREVNVSMVGNSYDPANYRLPDDMDRKYLGEALSTLRRDGDALSRRLDAHETRTHVSILAYDSGTHAWGRIRKAIEQRLEARFKGVEGLGDRFDYHITGTSTLAHGANLSIIWDLLSSLGLAFLLICLLVTLTFRSIRIGLVSMVPNAIPLAVGLAFMGYVNFNLRVSTVVVFSIALGIAVDDTIHFLSRLSEEAKTGRPIDEVIERTLHGTGRALVLSTVILVAGFMVNAMSEFISIQQFGVLSSFTMVAALICDLFVLPVLAKRFRLYGTKG